MKLSEIHADHIRRAAREIDRIGVPRPRRARDFEVVVDGKTYPPKYLISVACRMAGLREPISTEFITTHARGIITTRGFTVRRKSNGPATSSETQRADSILLTWRDPEADGSTDVFPLNFFSESSELGVIHEVRGPRGGEYEAKCRVSIKDQTAELDYEKFRAFNEEHEMFLGITRLTFADQDRTAICKAEWKPRGTAEFIDCKFDASRFETTPSPRYVRPIDTIGKVARMVRERPGQAEFRRKLRASYSNKCCITGCMIAQALEGAHIDPYISPESDNMQNGLLLRRDIHSLFDAHLISIEPETLTIRVAADIRCDPVYDGLDGKRIRNPGDTSHRPDVEALTRHWNSFRQQKSIS